MMNQTLIKTLIIFGLRWWLLIQAIQVIEDDYDYESPINNPNNFLSSDAFLQESIHQILDIKSCGFRHFLNNNDETFDSYIVGGQKSPPNSWPWMVGIYRMRRFLCGGTIINAQHILTAAHCIQRGGNLVPNDHLKVLIGAHRIQPINWPAGTINGSQKVAKNNRKLPNGIWFSVSKVLAHENYSLGFMQNDIAMLRLNATLNFQQYLLGKESNRKESNNRIPKEGADDDRTGVFYQPICLPALDKIGNDTGLIGHNATIIGWGHQHEGGAITPILNEVQVPIISNEQCRKTYGYRRIHQTKQICALHPDGGRDSCQGDSGGPLIIAKEEDGDGRNVNNTEKSKRFYQLGIVSWGRGCARPEIPGVYTRVSQYLDWILEQVKQASSNEN